MRNRFLRGVVPALALSAALAVLPGISSAGVFIGVSVNIAPPPLPVYVQPPCPEPGYLWVPGYWAWDDGAYYWVPGTWVLPPQVGLLWTPGYWGWDDGLYVWHIGYWGPQVGFYGGVNYGYGYDGDGYDGGYWRGGEFYYNRAVMHVGPTFVRNVYYQPVVYRTRYEHVSFNGGPGGVVARPTRHDMRAERERRFGVTHVQQRQQRMAFADRALRADYNHGRPPIAATVRPAVFHGPGTFAARAAGGPVHFAPSHRSPALRTDRPSWATGQPRGDRSTERSSPMERGGPMERSGSMHAQPDFARPPQRSGNAPQQRFDSRPRNDFQGRGYHPGYPSMEPRQDRSYPPGYHPMERPQPRPEQQFRPEFGAPERGPAMRAGPREPPRGASRPYAPPQDHRPPPREDRGGRGR